MVIKLLVTSQGVAIIIYKLTILAYYQLLYSIITSWRFLIYFAFVRFWFLIVHSTHNMAKGPALVDQPLEGENFNKFISQQSIHFVLFIGQPVMRWSK